MVEMKLTRRDFIKSNAVAAAATVAGISVPGMVAAQGRDDGVRWDKGVCRYCGTGCGVLVGVKDGRIVATQGDPDAPVNRGLNCIKGYFLSKIQYGKDRLMTPLLRMKDGKYDKNGDFKPITWTQALDIMEEKCKAALKTGAVDRMGRLRGRQTDEGRFPNQQPRSQCPPLHGFGGCRVYADVRYRRADGVL